MSVIVEPFRIKMVEPIRMTSREERLEALEKAHHNVFFLDAEDCYIDLLTDSGTGAMSQEQWAAVILGDESYAGSKSFKKFAAVVKEITGMKHVLPTHQGRAAEGILAETQVKPGNCIPNNTHFDTTRANLKFVGGNPLDFPCPTGEDLQTNAPFKGNINLEAVANILHEQGADNIPFCMLTITNNAGGGQPVSLENIKALKKLLNQYQIPLVMDACRFAENSYFIREREEGYKNKSLLEIAQETFSYADAITMSCKKDGLANIGGFLACQDDQWAEGFRNSLIMREGFPTYGGLAGRDMEAIAVGLKEVLQYEYQSYRHSVITYLGDNLEKIGVPLYKPMGGHAVFIDAKTALPHIPAEQYPGLSLVNALYITGGIRSVEMGSVMFGHIDEQGHEVLASKELVRLTVPRRVYTQSHYDYIIEVMESLWQQRDQLKGYRFTYQPKYLRHFLGHFQLID